MTYETQTKEAASAAQDDARLIGLMLRARDDDEGAFRELVEATEDRVYGTIAKMLGGREGADDLTQTVYLRIWRARQRYAPTAKFSTWLFSIVRRLVLNERRGRARRGAVFHEEPEGGVEAVARDSPAAEASAAELARAIDGALAELPGEQRMAMVLRRYEEMPYEEIARVLDTTVPAVKSLLFRARETLRSKLAAWL